jgi:hypothetical protein
MNTMEQKRFGLGAPRKIGGGAPMDLVSMKRKIALINAPNLIHHTDKPRGASLFLKPLSPNYLRGSQ